jgi:hypothetical protein
VSSAIRIAYRHLSGCPKGDCPGHHATIRHPKDVDRVLTALSQSHPERPICIERVRETSEDGARRTGDAD